MGLSTKNPNEQACGFILGEDARPASKGMESNCRQMSCRQKVSTAFKTFCFVKGNNFRQNRKKLQTLSALH